MTSSLTWAKLFSNSYAAPSELVISQVCQMHSLICIRSCIYMSHLSHWYPHFLDMQVRIMCRSFFGGCKIQCSLSNRSVGCEMVAFIRYVYNLSDHWEPECIFRPPYFFLFLLELTDWKCVYVKNICEQFLHLQFASPSPVESVVNIIISWQSSLCFAQSFLHHTEGRQHTETPAQYFPCVDW